MSVLLLIRNGSRWIKGTTFLVNIEQISNIGQGSGPQFKPAPNKLYNYFVLIFFHYPKNQTGTDIMLDEDTCVWDGARNTGRGCCWQLYTKQEINHLPSSRVVTTHENRINSSTFIIGYKNKYLGRTKYRNTGRVICRNKEDYGKTYNVDIRMAKRAEQKKITG